MALSTYGGKRTPAAVAHIGVVRANRKTPSSNHFHVSRDARQHGLAVAGPFIRRICMKPLGLAVAVFDSIYVRAFELPLVQLGQSQFRVYGGLMHDSAQHVLSDGTFGFLPTFLIVHYLKAFCLQVQIHAIRSA